MADVDDGDEITLPPAPPDLRAGGVYLWTDVVERHWPLVAAQLVQLHEACRMKDRLDALAPVLAGDVDTYARFIPDPQDPSGHTYKLVITPALSRANETAQGLKQLIAALRLPDETGKRPQRRGARGAQAPSVPGGKGPGSVSPLDQYRASKGG